MKRNIIKKKTISKTKILKVSGVDYSLTCPAITVHFGNNWNFENCKFYFHTPIKKFVTKNSNIDSIFAAKWLHTEERHQNLANWAIKILDDSDYIFIEGYAYRALGSNFSIGENCGHLKQCIRQQTNSPFDILQPSAIKKFTTSKGNAKKIHMYEVFLKETNYNLEKVLLGNPEKSPISDIVDSYFICKFGFFNKIKDLEII